MTTAAKPALEPDELGPWERRCIPPPPLDDDEADNGRPCRPSPPPRPGRVATFFAVALVGPGRWVSTPDNDWEWRRWT